VAIDTDGDNAGKSISVPVSGRPTLAPSPAQSTPQWDDLYVPSATTALVIAFGTDPEEIIPVNLTTGAAGTAIPLSNLSDSSGCGNTPQLGVGITQDGSTAVVGDPSTSSVYTVNLSTGARGRVTRLSTSGTITAVLSPTGYSDWTFGS
jgi:hypothetical protein